MSNFIFVKTLHSFETPVVKVRDFNREHLHGLREKLNRDFLSSNR